MQKATMMELGESEAIALAPSTAPRKKQAMVRRASKSGSTMIGGLSVDNIANLRKLDQKRGARFQYDPQQITTFMHHFSGTITSVIMCSPWVWFNVLVYIAWLTADILVQRGGKHPPLEAVDHVVLATPGGLFAFFIMGQLGRAIHRYNSMKGSAGKLGLHVKTTAYLLTAEAGDQADPQTLASIRAIVSKASAAHMFFMMSVAEDRYLDVVYPEWFVTNGHVDSSFDISEPPAPDAHFQQLHIARSLLGAYSRSTEHGQHTCHRAKDELDAMMKGMIGLTGKLASPIPPSLHYFASMFLVIFLPLVSMNIAQLKGSAAHHTLDMGVRIFSWILGGLAVFLINFAFYGMFYLVGTVHHPFGCDTVDVAIFTNADKTQQACDAMFGYSAASAPTGEESA
jgi:hypothetical protein